RRARPITRRLRKMIAQELKEASSSSPMTICTGTLAWTMSRRMESWSPTGGGLPGDDLGEERRQALRPQRTCVHAGDAHVRFEERRGLPAARGPAAGAAAVDALREADRRRPEGLRLAGDLELVIEARGRAVLDREARHREHNAALARELLLRVSARAQPLGASALEEAQVAGVVDDAGAVGVLPVDAHRPAEGAHRGSSNSCSVAAARSGGVRPRCRYEARVDMRPRGVRTRERCAMRAAPPSSMLTPRIAAERPTMRSRSETV